jgi:hypothetical protein
MVGSSCKNPKRLGKRAFPGTVTVTDIVIVTVTVRVTKDQRYSESSF